MESMLKKEDKLNILKLFFRKNSNYYLSSNLKKDIIEEINTIENVVKVMLKNQLTDEKMEKIFFDYCKKENFEITYEFLNKLEMKLGFRINDKVYYKIFSYILILLNFDEISNNKEMLIRKFMSHTMEYLIVEEIMKNILKEKYNNRDLKETTLIQITDVVMGITLNNFESGCFECWIDEDCIVDKIVKKISEELKIKKLTEDKILHNGILHHIKLAVYRIKNNIQIINSVYNELILGNDSIIKIVKKAMDDTKDTLGIEFSEYEISCIGFQVKAAIKRYERLNIKKVVLICGLGYGSSKVLEQSLKENYDLDIIDVLPYYLADDIVHNYRRVDYIISTINLNKKYHIPVIKINPILEKKDFELLENYGIKKSKNRISLTKLLNIIEENGENIQKENLIKILKKEFSGNIIDDLDNCLSNNFKKYFNEKSVKFVDKLENWEDGIRQVGKILVDQKFATNEYVDEMVELVEKHGPYIVIEEGIAMPHAGVSNKVLETGVALLISKEKVKFSDGRGANVFFSFTSISKSDRPEILNDLFELITKYDFVKTISKIENYEELKKYFDQL